MAKSLLRCKRGDISDEIYNFLFTVFIVAFVFFSILTVVAGLRDQTRFKQDWLSFDLLLTLSAMEASPGNVRNFVYTKDGFNLGQYRYEFVKSYMPGGEDGKNQLLITKPISTKEEPIIARHTYADSQTKVALGWMESVSGIVMDEQENAIVIESTKA